MLIQLLLIAGIIIVATLVVQKMPGEKSLALKRVLASLFVVLAVLAIIFPTSLTTVANFLGIGRGTDLLLYFFVMVFLVFSAAVIRAKARSDARVTKLARAVALIEARARESMRAKTE